MANKKVEYSVGTVIGALIDANGIIKEAAALLGCSQKTLERIIRENDKLQMYQDNGKLNDDFFAHTRIKQLMDEEGMPGVKACEVYFKVRNMHEANKLRREELKLNKKLVDKAAGNEVNISIGF